MAPDHDRIDPRDDRSGRPDDLAALPSVADLRRRMARRVTRVGTGWPVLDDVGQGLPVGAVTMIHAPDELRLQVLGRMAAWAAGEGYRTLLASCAWSTEELWLAVAAGGIGLPGVALLDDPQHDDWLDARLRVLDLHVHGGRTAPQAVRGVLEAGPVPLVMIIDDYALSFRAWDPVLDPVDESFNLRVVPRELGAAVVLGGPAPPEWASSPPEVGVGLLLNLKVPAGAGTAEVRGTTPTRHVVRRTPLRDGFLEPPTPGDPLIRRPHVTNVWDDPSDQDVSSFAAILGRPPTPAG